MNPLKLKVPPEAVELLCMQRTQYYKVLNEAYTLEIASTFANISPFLPANVRNSLDIGAGMAGIDAFIAQKYPDAQIHLLDIDGVSPKPKVNWHASVEEFGHYCSFDAARSVLKSAGVPPARVSCVSAYPKGKSFDLIMSFLSWGFHYPIDTYLNQAVKTLNPGGVLIMDIRKDAPDAGSIKCFKEAVPIAEGEKWVRVAFSN